MEGKWGRHIYGRVIEGKQITLFELESELVAGNIYSVEHVVLTRYLQETPDLYGRILLGMTDELEKKLREGLGIKYTS